MSKGPKYCEMNSGWLRSMKRAERDAKKARAERIARRDAEYAAHAAPVTVEERELRNSELGVILRIERRGTCPIAPRITHMGRC